MSDSTPHSKGEAEPLLPHDWPALAPLVDAVLDAPPERRAAVLAEVSGGDLGRRAELERLVAECERDVPLLNRPAAERFARLLESEPDVSLPETLGGRYRIERELGRGGMARVYLAHDLKHARHVAVKVIRADLAASLGRERFLREIGIAARLRHPNIVPLYDSGDADGVLYFVMPYEEGPSLRGRLDRGDRLPAADCVSVLRDVARALAYAHEHGVVHRDVKPDNVMLSGGAAVVTDFGIAKAVSVAQGDGSPSTLTQVGAGMGTPAYMAPEQAVGDPATDHRADIYSFGCLAYELFAGKPPFHGLPTHEIIAAHVGTKPIPVTEVFPGVPDSVARLIARCLEKSPAARPQSAQELMTELEGSATTPNEVVRRHRVSGIVVGALSLIGVMLIGTAGYFVSRGRASSGTPVGGELTVTVLPLRNLGGDSLHSDLADGLSDEISVALWKQPGVRSVSRLGAANYRSRDVDLAKIGRELGARFLVMGSLREVGSRLTVLAQLVDVTNGDILWSDRFERSPDELGVVRDEIARSVGDALRTKSGTPVGDATSAQKPTRAISPEPYRLYLLAQRALDRRGQSIRASVDMFRRATELDTLYAEAFSGLSLALAFAPYFQLTPAREVAAEVRSAAQRALRLDPTLAPPHVALGLMYQNDYQWDRATDEFETAVRLRRRDDVEPLIQYARHLILRGRLAEGMKQYLLARSDEPASAVLSSHVSYAYSLLGQTDSALVESARAFQSDSTNMTTLGLGALVRFRAGRIAEARAMANKAAPNSPNPFYVLAAIGDTAIVFNRLRKLESQRPKPWMTETQRALAMLGVGDSTQAMAALERATAAREIWHALTPTLDPMYDLVRGSARFQALLRSVGLPATPPAASSSPVSR